MKGNLVLLFLVVSGQANAQGANIILSPSVHYSDNLQQRGSEDTTKSSSVTTNLTAAYQFDPGLFVGARLYYERVSVEVSEELADDNRVTETSNGANSGLGMTVGYNAKNGLSVAAAYLFLEPQSKLSGTTMYGGNAQIYDLAYRIEFGDWGVGPLLSLVMFEYKKLKNSDGSTDLSGRWRDQHFRPYAAFWFYY